MALPFDPADRETRESALARAEFDAVAPTTADPIEFVCNGSDVAEHCDYCVLLS